MIISIRYSLSVILFFLISSYALAGQTFNPFTGKPDKCVTIQETDASPADTQCKTILVPNSSMTDNGDGTYSLSFSAGSGDVTSVGDCATGDCFTGATGNTITFKGATSGTTALKPTAISGTTTLTLPAATDTLVGKDTTDTLTNKTLAAANNVIDADTAVALAANGGNCAASSFPLGIDASGAVESCSTSISGNSATATALAADPADCGANTFATTIAASGALTCASIGDADVPNTITIDLATLATTATTANAGDSATSFFSSGTLEVAIGGTGTTTSTGTGAVVLGTSPTFTTDVVFPALAVEAGALAAASVDGDDINSNLAGRSLTLTAASPDTLDADAELYTDTKCIYWENPIATDDFKSIWYSVLPVTLTKIWAESDQTVTFMLQVDDGTPADVDSVDLAPAAGTATDTSLDGDTTMATGDRLDMAVTSVANTPTWASVCWEYTKDE